MNKFYALTSFIIIAYAIYKIWTPAHSEAIIFTAKFVMVGSAIIYLINFCAKFFGHSLD